MRVSLRQVKHELRDLRHRQSPIVHGHYRRSHRYFFARAVVADGFARFAKSARHAICSVK